MTEAEARAFLLNGVSRETWDRLGIYHETLTRWQKAINLIAPTTLDHIWSRHFVDSAQLIPIAGNCSGKWLDLGSGAGFPGLVCAILLAEEATDLEFVLVESDARKCSFLREVIRQTDITCQVITHRIEELPPQTADIITARALAPLDTLLDYALTHLKHDGKCLFPKGVQVDAELETAGRRWQMNVTQHKSITSDRSVILEIEGVSHAAQ